MKKNTIIKRIICSALTFIMLFGLISTASAAVPELYVTSYVHTSQKSYDAAKAIRYASAHWNDGVGLCAEFVSKCIRSGGLSSYSGTTYTLCQKLAQEISLPYVEPSQQTRIVLRSDGYAYQEDNPNLSPGDVVFYVCPNHTYTSKVDGKKYPTSPHVMLFAGFNKEHRATFYAHNAALSPAKGSKQLNHLASSTHKNCVLYATYIDLTCSIEQFTDVRYTSNTDNHRYYEYMVNAGLMKGNDDNTVKPNNPVTRAEIAMFLYRAAGSPALNTSVPMVFRDVPSGAWYYNAVYWCYTTTYDGTTRITNGTSATTFEPNSYVTRQELATFLWRFVQYSKRPLFDVYDDPVQYQDYGEIDAWAKTSMSWALKYGCFNTPNGYIHPKANATRRDVCQAFYYALNTR